MKTNVVDVVLGIALAAFLFLFGMEFREMRAEEEFQRARQTRVDGYCSVDMGRRCVETGTSCQDQGTVDHPKACASWIDPANDPHSLHCTCLDKPN